VRLDKYLKVARVIKRRTIAHDVCAAGRVEVNGRVAKPGLEVKPGDLVAIRFGTGTTRIRILSVPDVVRKEQAAGLYDLLEDGEPDLPV